jgi:hypothetical protein
MRISNMIGTAEYESAVSLASLRIRISDIIATAVTHTVFSSMRSYIRYTASARDRISVCGFDGDKS